jgi:hypothetical protein
MHGADWESRVAGLWEDFDDYEPEAFVAAMEQLAAERDADDPVALFEVGGSYDSTGRTRDAIVKYRRALDAGLSGVRRRRATIQMASSMRETGEPEAALELLLAERERGSDEYDDAIAMCMALTYAKLGREREGLSVALIALAPHLPRYQRSTVNYARGLVDG